MTVLRYVPRTKNYYITRGRDTAWTPDVDIIEGEDKFTLEIDLPGFKKNDFGINVKDGVLHINGERKSEVPEDGKYYRHLERPDGKFERSFRLPDHVNGEKIKASYKSGVLKLELPKKEEAKPLTVQITE